MAVFALCFGALALLCILMDWSVAWALLAGVGMCWLLGRKRGFSWKELVAMSWSKCRPAMIVVRVILLIGAITGLWRCCGTIAGCVVGGVSLVQPPLFLLITFLLCVALSYILGTSYGVSSTVGVIMMALARFGGVNPAMTAGVILSGVYFGDRCSPNSSAASLVAAVTGTDLYKNVKQMLKTGLLPTLLTLGVYAVFSVRNPLHQVNAEVMELVGGAFQTGWPVFLPAIAMLFLPLLKVKIHICLWVSIGVSALVALLVQKVSVTALLSAAVLGYHPETGALDAVLGGGGLVSMVRSCCIVLLSGCLSGLLEGTGCLSGLDTVIGRMVAKIGRFPAMNVVSLAVAVVLCNQAVTSVMAAQLMGKCYADKEELALDIENSGIMLSGLVPWSVACSVPLAMLGAEVSALPYAMLLWVTPICYLFTKKWFYKGL